MEDRDEGGNLKPETSAFSSQPSALASQPSAFIPQPSPAEPVNVVPFEPPQPAHDPDPAPVAAAVPAWRLRTLNAWQRKALGL